MIPLVRAHGHLGHNQFVAFFQQGRSEIHGGLRQPASPNKNIPCQCEFSFAVERHFRPDRTTKIRLNERVIDQRCGAIGFHLEPHPWLNQVVERRPEIEIVLLLGNALVNLSFGGSRCRPEGDEYRKQNMPHDGHHLTLTLRN